MKLLIVSDLPHYKRNGQIVGWGTTVREINHLARMFEEIRYVACLHPDPAPDSALPYDTDKIKLIPLPPSGGKSLRAKLTILRFTPLYLKTIYRELSWADMVHVRCPNNIGLLAMLLLSAVSSPKMRWFKYAANWNPTFRDPWSWIFQRWWLGKGWQKGIVTINGNWPDQSPHVYTILNPTLTEAEINSGQAVGKYKELKIPIYLLYIGTITLNKGAERALKIAQSLIEQNINIEFNFIGDGPEKVTLERRVREQGLTKWITFHGWFPRTELGKFYEAAHFLVLPSISEGWPNVISEALGFGVVPLAGAVSVIPKLLKQIGSGQALDPLDVNAFVQAIKDYTAHPERWKAEIMAGLRSAYLFSYNNYLESLRDIFSENWGIMADRNGRLQNGKKCLQITNVNAD